MNTTGDLSSDARVVVGSLRNASIACSRDAQAMAVRCAKARRPA